jgi:predicted alpha/beta-fold hydrolase
VRKCRFWHPGLYDDSKFVIQHINATFPESSIFMVGYSAGTNIIQKTVLDPTLGVRIRGIMCVCVGVDYIGARNALEDSFQGRMYSRLMTALSKVLFYS